MANRIGGVRATIVGAGLLTLDTIVSNRQSENFRHRVGGTFGNVLSICRTLGLNGRPVTRIGVDQAGDKIVSELESLGVDCIHVERDSAVRTRQITELAPASFDKRHRFTIVCPFCRKWLPQGKSLTIERAKHFPMDWEAVDLFFFDRASPSSMFFARKAVFA